jgi:hypothetical protein
MINSQSSLLNGATLLFGGVLTFTVALVQPIYPRRLRPLVDCWPELRQQAN